MFFLVGGPGEPSSVGIVRSLSAAVQCLYPHGHTSVRLRFTMGQEMPESKLSANVLTALFYEPTVALHDKQGGRVVVSFPTDLEKYMGTRPFHPFFSALKFNG